MHSINIDTFLFINGFSGASHSIDRIFLFITNPLIFILLGSTALWFLVAAPLIERDPYKRLLALRQALSMIVTFFIVWACVEFLKGFISFPRPHQYFHGLRTLLVYGEYDSFPSLHAAFSFTLATFLYYRSRRVGILLFITAALVAISRVYVGVHFPLDIIVGGAIGVLIPYALHKVFKN